MRQRNKIWGSSTRETLPSKSGELPSANPSQAGADKADNTLRCLVRGILSDIIHAKRYPRLKGIERNLGPR